MMMSTASPSPTPSSRSGGEAGDLLGPHRVTLEHHLESSVRRRGLPLVLEEAVLYALLGGGKRLRPTLVIAACEAAGGEAGRAMHAASAIELVHAFSLVHDDLPAMDDDDVRRGRPSLHVQAGEATAILAGDAMVALAFEQLAEAPVAPTRRLELVKELAAADTAMIGGQVLDTVGGFPYELDAAQRLVMIHRGKTAALLRAAVRMGAHCAEADDATVEALTAYGSAVGVMFQIVDDLIDVEQSAEHAGKATGKDDAAGKLTWPGVHGVEASRAEVARLLEEALAAVASLGPAAEPLRRLARTMAVRTK